ncbi:MAG: TfoX/Sxy family protein [Chloroflexi bacterium]|nr:TfoX/Sxy family protein [Chloroflexota bacterium]
MAKEYLDKLSDLVTEIVSDMSTTVDLEIKHFFSGAAAYADGRICISLTPAGFALKLPDALRNELMREKNAKHLRYFPKSPIKKDYVVLPDKILDDKNMLCYWVEKSIEYVLTLPKPKKKKG